MTDNYSFKDADGLALQRSAKESSAGIYANKDVEVFESGASVKESNYAECYAISVDTVSNLLIGAYPNRKGLIISNNSTANLMIMYNNPVTALNNTGVRGSLRILPFAYWTMPYPIFKEEIFGCWDAFTNGVAYVTQLL